MLLVTPLSSRPLTTAIDTSHRGGCSPWASCCRFSAPAVAPACCCACRPPACGAARHTCPGLLLPPQPSRHKTQQETWCSRCWRACFVLGLVQKWVDRFGQRGACVCVKRAGMDGGRAPVLRGETLSRALAELAPPTIGPPPCPSAAVGAPIITQVVRRPCPTTRPEQRAAGLGRRPPLFWLSLEHYAGGGLASAATAAPPSRVQAPCGAHN